MPTIRRRTLTRRTLVHLGLAAPALALLPRGLHAADAPVRIGAPYPLTRVAASAGTAVKQAIEVAVDIINNPHPELPNLPLAPTAGLPGLGGRKVEVIFADHQGNPAIAQSEALRLITQDKVAALVSYDPGKPGSPSFVVNDIYQKHAGHALDDTSARGMQGFLALMEAINRAGSTEPAKIQAALVSQDLKPEQLMIGYNGIKYDAKRQNTLAATLLVQLQGKSYVRVWPEKSALQAPALPFKGWG